MCQSPRWVLKQRVVVVQVTCPDTEQEIGGCVEDGLMRDVAEGGGEGERLRDSETVVLRQAC